MAVIFLKEIVLNWIKAVRIVDTKLKLETLAHIQ